jgi:hypothetical protein
MGLTIGGLENVPGLTPADEDDESDEGADGDLLGMVAGASATAAKTVMKSASQPVQKHNGRNASHQLVPLWTWTPR